MSYNWKRAKKYDRIPPIVKLLVKELEEQEMTEEQRKKLRAIIARRDRELKKEQEWARENVCPICHSVLTTRKKCPYGHSF